MSEQRCHLVIGKVEARHSFIETARVYQRGDFGIGMGNHKAKQRRSTVSPVAITPVADSAAVRKGSDGRRRLLRPSTAGEKKNHAKKSLEHRRTLPASATTRSASIRPHLRQDHGASTIASTPPPLAIRDLVIDTAGQEE
jgi:hypothetical protein